MKEVMIVHIKVITYLKN